MNEETPETPREETSGIGAGLRRAREARGMSMQDVGSRLRLMSRQVEAIEDEEFSKLGPPVFARGFVRNYAKLLGLDAEELLERMTRIKTAPVKEDEDKLPFQPSQGFWTSPLVLAGIAVVLLLIAIPVGLYLFLNSGEEETTPAVEQQVPPPPPPPAPQAEIPPASATVESSPVLPLATPAAPATPSATPVNPATPANPAMPTSPASSTNTSPPTAVPTKAATPGVVPAPAVQAPATVPAGASVLSMQFDQPSWVQIRDGSGRLVHSGLNPAGSAVELNGKAPFYLVVGNAKHVRMNYKGQAIDLKPFTAINVARLTLKP